MSTVTEQKPAETIPTTEEVAKLQYSGYRSINGRVVAGDFTRPGLEGRIAKWMASDPELVRFRAEARDEREMETFLINAANDSPLAKPFHGKPINSIDFDMTSADWIEFLSTLDVVPRDGTIRIYRREIAKRRESAKAKEATQALGKPDKLSPTIAKTLSQYRNRRERETWTRLHQLIADASSKGLSEFVLAELATVADQLELTDEKVAREFEAFEARG